ncbi:dihydrodipicolinate synthase family protein [Pseudooceanicola sp. CBS1P-1]|uniref:Dihydrodipicolinate synthase family protein n=1 Tax=Pseudooceanicola albus TaxID=2692189 RepID=A0A6L7GB49_9RHOB|nr:MULTISPECIES: dihydrodipicolinate synthase family protein [Pseudooceanicola]MBT9386642.1 dihydrodipicolinate synthase family protein [Pseudooceanicola endophyticus]MXN20758.1 dihydrodipicolinate synthase family protein [Pseudooceanicola albus]
MSAALNGGLYAATICPMTEAGALDGASLEAHFAAVLSDPGQTGLLLNGHAGEGIHLSRAEQAEVVRIARNVAGQRRILAAVSAESTAAAVADARAALAAGADAIMVFAPFSWALGVDPRAVLTHHRGIAEATGAPLYLFQGAVTSGGLHYDADLLRALLEIDAVTGIKEGSWEVKAYETTLRTARQQRPDVAVMASGDEHLFACYLLGSDGSAVSLSALVPEAITALDSAVRGGDMDRARRIHAALFDLARRIYARPGHLAAARIKCCLAELGRIASPACRAPTPPIDPAERAALMAALRPCLEMSP